MKTVMQPGPVTLMKIACLAGILLLPVIPAAAVPLAPAEVAVATTHLPAGAALTPIVRLAPGPAGSQYLEVTLRNESGGDITLGEARIGFPWLEADSSPALVASGGTTMYTWPTQVGEPGADASAKRGSGTYLLAKQAGGYAIAAFLSWRTFWSTLVCEGTRAGVRVDGEDRRIRPGEIVALEKIWLASGPDWQDLLLHSADEIAREQAITLKPQPHYVGWSTWDYFGREWTPQNVRDNLAAVQQLVPEGNLVQIDGGWWEERGDYLLLRDNLKPDGMKQLATAIHERGLTAGIHFDGMRADRGAKVAREHPEYFMHDDTGAVVGPRRANADPDRGIIFFDFSNPKALDYMRDVTRQMRREWGFNYIKIDFLLTGIAANVRGASFRNDPARRLAPQDPGMTSVERLRAGMRAWREGMGNDAWLLACSAPYGPMFGLADGLRSGYDISPNFEQARRCAQATAGAFQFQGRVIWNDADYHVVRAAADEDQSVATAEGKKGKLTANEAGMWTHYVGLFGGSKINSDNLPTLRPERKELFRQAVALPSCERFIPLDFWARARNRDDAYHVMLGAAAGSVYLAVFNWSDGPRQYRLDGLPPGTDRIAGEAGETGDAFGCRITLAGRHSAIYRLPAGADFDRMRRQIQVGP
jgi:alpha-galactosidase